jgi:VanZ family protein
MLMVTLLLAVPFGTLIYLIGYGSFDRGLATAVLSVIMTLKLGFAVCLILAHQGFVKMKGLVLIILTSIAAGIVVSFLHGVVPGILVSITDAIAGIVVGILAALWALFFLIGSIPSIVKSLKLGA